MKKIFLSLVISVISVISFGQTWEKQVVKGDELKGTTDKEYFIYSEPRFMFALSDKESNNEKTGLFNSHKPHITLMLNKGNILDYHYNRLSGLNVCIAYLGYYDNNAKMINKTKIYFYISSDNSNMGIAYAEYKKIYEFLSTENGYIRLIVPIFNEDDLDIQIPCWNND